MKNMLPRCFHFAFCTVLLAALSACGGGSSSSGNMAPPMTPQSATVGVLLTDAPSDAFSEINATITSIDLMGGGSPQNVFSGSRTVDLLSLDGSSDLFALSNSVTPGTFNKIRLTLSGLELVRRDAAGNVVERVSPHLPGNGKVDLNPRGSFSVAAGDTLLVELDLDMQKSIHIVGTGRDRVQFRPVIFVRIMSGHALNGRLARVFGVVNEIDAAAHTFDLCRDPQQSGEDEEDGDDNDDGDGMSGGGDDDSDDDGHDGHCVEVAVADTTGIFGEDGAPITFADLAVGDHLTAVGKISKQDDDEDMDQHEDDVRLDAVVIEVGAADTFARLKGTIKTALDATSNRFDFGVDSGQGLAPETVLSTLVQDGTRIFGSDGNELDSSALVVDKTARIDGVVQLSDTEADTLRAALIVIDVGETAETVLRGDILTIDADHRSFNMSTDGGDRCVRVPEDADIFLITTSDDGFESDRGEFSDLQTGKHADVFGTPGEDGCLVADTVIADVTPTP